MNPAFLWLALTLPAVDYGWQTTPDGAVEYIVQIEPQLLESLKSGAAITSEIHPDVRGVRRFRIVVGTGSVPKEEVSRPSPPVLLQPPVAPFGPRPSPTEAPATGGAPAPAASAPPRERPAPTNPPLAESPLPESAAPPPEKSNNSPPLLTPPFSVPQDSTTGAPGPAPAASAAPTFEPRRSRFSDSPSAIPSTSPPPSFIFPAPSTNNPNTSLENHSGAPVMPQPIPDLGPRASAPSMNDPAAPSSSGVPGPLPADPGPKPLANRPATFEEPVPLGKPELNEVPASQASPSPPWLMTVLLLFASLGVNVYLGWSWWDARGRYRALLLGQNP